MGEMQATSRGRALSPGLYGIGLAALSLCACAIGVPIDELSRVGDAAASAGDPDDEDMGSDEATGSDADASSSVPPWDAGGTSPGVDASAMGGAARDAASDASATSDANRSEAGSEAGRDAGGGTTGGGTTGGGTTGGGTTGGGTTGGGTTGGTADAGRPDAGTPDAGRPDAGGGTTGGGMCEASKCTNDCSLGDGPLRCCTRDGQCGCSWFSVAYCND
jgi:hypothetical protein